MVLAGCGGTPNQTSSSGDAPATPAAPPDVRVLAGRIDRSIGCHPTDKPEATRYSYRTMSCDYQASDGVSDYMYVSTYNDAAQLAAAKRYLMAPGGGPNPGSVYVVGDLWTVRVGDRATAMRVARVLHGRVAG